MIEIINQIVAWSNGHMVNIIVAIVAVGFFLIHVYDIGGGNVKA
jgi:hypothetical protein